MRGRERTSTRWTEGTFEYDSARTVEWSGQDDVGQEEGRDGCQQIEEMGVWEVYVRT